MSKTQPPALKILENHSDVRNHVNHGQDCRAVQFDPRKALRGVLGGKKQKGKAISDRAAEAACTLTSSYKSRLLTLITSERRATGVSVSCRIKPPVKDSLGSIHKADNSLEPSPEGDITLLNEVCSLGSDFSVSDDTHAFLPSVLGTTWIILGDIDQYIPRNQLYKREIEGRAKCNTPRLCYLLV